MYLLETTQKLYVLPQDSAQSVQPAPSERLSLEAGPATAPRAEPPLATLDAFRVLQNRMRGEHDVDNIAVEFQQLPQNQWECRLNFGLWFATGTGSSKKGAKREAAAAALQELSVEQASKRPSR